MTTNKKKIMWIGWVVMTGLMASYYTYALVSEDKSVYLPGSTSSGHYQIELACNVCHTDGFGGKDSLQKACMNCHGPELKTVDDSHPKSKFTDPRNADRIAILDARYCVTCHKEHVPDRTHNMGVTLPDDFCAYCHQKIEKDRPSHKGMAFDTCASAGCHNFHDNKALYEDFLVKYGRDTNETVDSPAMAERNFSRIYRKDQQEDGKSIEPLTNADADFPGSVVVPPKLLQSWADSSHARVSVNCMDCHKDLQAEGALKWRNSPKPATCKHCHDREVITYFEGKHGMRLQQKLSRMNTSMARQKLKQDIKDKDLDCNSCHGAHDFSTTKAAVESCMSCHDDKHTKAFTRSPHYKLWERFKQQQASAEQAVSCATCHLPRVEIKYKGEIRVLVNHNQNHNLRPNEKMIRDVCMQCHSLRFAIDSLADPELVANNFKGKPGKVIASVDMAIKREKIKAKEKKNKKSKKGK